MTVTSLCLVPFINACFKRHKQIELWFNVYSILIFGKIESGNYLHKTSFFFYSKSHLVIWGVAGVMKLLEKLDFHPKKYFECVVIHSNE